MAEEEQVIPTAHATRQFYDSLSEDYHLIFHDWAVSRENQARIIHTLIQEKIPRAPKTLSVLDCSCGIGTQAIGLAKLGYRITATDLSPKAVERARAEAGKAGVAIRFGVADFCHLEEQVPDIYDVVLSFDNSLPHLLEDHEFSLAFRSIRGKLKNNGLFLASIRDYDRLAADRPNLTTPSFHDNEHGKRVSFQIWEWEGRVYTIHHFIIRKVGANWETGQRTTRYRAVLRGEMGALLESAGFRELEWRMPEDSGFYQPVVAARKE